MFRRLLALAVLVGLCAVIYFAFKNRDVADRSPAITAAKQEYEELKMKAEEMISGPLEKFKNGVDLLESERSILEESLIDLRRMIELDPNEPSAAVSMAETLRALGRIDDAKAALEQALASNPNYQPAQELLESL
ncbi:MAG: tetratricopeptide repeat protein [Armatimonadetes bacterium]|nr:tetratricopeptide repeat protein [Armatimonadota bacterium]